MSISREAASKRLAEADHLTFQLGAGLWHVDGRPDPGATEPLIPAGEGWFPQASLRVIFEF